MCSFICVAMYIDPSSLKTDFSINILLFFGILYCYYPLMYINILVVISTCFCINSCSIITIRARDFTATSMFIIIIVLSSVRDCFITFGCHNSCVMLMNVLQFLIKIVTYYSQLVD